LDEEHKRLVSGVDLFAPLSLEKIESIAQGIPSKDFGRSEHVFTPAYRGRYSSCYSKVGYASTVWRRGTR
jgi:hypothetical protein